MSNNSSQESSAGQRLVSENTRPSIAEPATSRPPSVRNDEGVDDIRLSPLVTRQHNETAAAAESNRMPDDAHPCPNNAARVGTRPTSLPGSKDQELSGPQPAPTTTDERQGASQEEKQGTLGARPFGAETFPDSQPAVPQSARTTMTERQGLSQEVKQGALGEKPFGAETFPDSQPAVPEAAPTTTELQGSSRGEKSGAFPTKPPLFGAETFPDSQPALPQSQQPPPPQKGLKGDFPEVFPDSVGHLVSNDKDTKQLAQPPKMESASRNDRNVAGEPTSGSISLASGPSTSVSDERQSTFEPPQSESVVGSVTDPETDGTSSGDVDFNNDGLADATTTTTTENGTSLPVARIADDTNLLVDLGQAEPVSAEDLKRQGVVGWIRQNIIFTAVAVLVLIGAIVGGAVGATSGGSSSPLPPAPTLAPTISPTPAPTLTGFGEIADTLSTITPYSVLTDPTTPQNTAVSWLLGKDEYGVDFNDAPKLLQRYSLATIYFATVGERWTRQLEFLTNQDDCLWTDVVDNTTFGVEECNEQGLVTKLQLSRNGLQGTLPEQVIGLPLLVEFGAADNNMKGKIPSGITTLTDLVDIYLFGSGVSGTIPQDINNLSKLTHLALQTNDLTGMIPSSLFALTSLENLYLHENRLSGTLPTTVGNLVSLKQFWLETNRLSGAIPTDVARMTSLVNIYLKENDFTGGMENFCKGSLDFNTFQSDCLNAVFLPVAEVECSCCTVCCSQGASGIPTCVPNEGSFNPPP